MTAVSNLAPSTLKTATPVVAPGVAPGAAAFLALLAPATGDAEDGAPARQEDAAPGKDLPDSGDQADLLTWVAPSVVPLPTLAPTVPPTPTSPSAPVALPLATDRKPSSDGTAIARAARAIPTPPALSPTPDPAPDATEVTSAAPATPVPIPLPTDRNPTPAMTAIAAAPQGTPMPPPLTLDRGPAPSEPKSRLATTAMTFPVVGDEPSVTPAPVPPPPSPPLAVSPHVAADPIIITPPAAPLVQPASAGDRATAPVTQVAAAVSLLPANPQPPTVATTTSDSISSRTGGQSAPLPAASAAASPAIALTPARAIAEPEIAQIAPAAQVFAAAIRRAASEDAPSVTTQPALAALPTGTDNTLHAVTAMADPRQPMLDMKQDNWPHQMIQHIEALRDAANANDASIRLIPDALGKIDVSLKRDGDGVSVRLDAHQPETRQILADAQPRLIELAESRGLKLSAATGSTTDTGGQAQQQQRANQPTFTRSAPPNATTEADDTAADDRIA